MCLICFSGLLCCSVVPRVPESRVLLKPLCSQDGGIPLPTARTCPISPSLLPSALPSHPPPGPWNTSLKAKLCDSPRTQRDRYSGILGKAKLFWIHVPACRRAGMGRCYPGALWEAGMGCRICCLHPFWVAAMPQGILHPSPPLSPGRCPQQRGWPSPASSGASSMRCRRARTSPGCSASSTRPCGRCGARPSGTCPCGHSSSLRSGPAHPRPRRWPCPPTTAWPPAPSTPSPPSTTRRSPQWPRPSWSPSSPRGLRAKGRLPRSPC